MSEHLADDVAQPIIEAVDEGLRTDSVCAAIHRRALAAGWTDYLAICMFTHSSQTYWTDDFAYAQKLVVRTQVVDSQIINVAEIVSAHLARFTDPPGVSS